ncbi:hypothetical protein [Leptolyngbya ohadii]|uniref:hypothetical protein n=1 Tax=Leptolyngbya ohadii TaxID=1962290 RepID=UPI00117A5A4C|nr:hypothetical protein [Leptolyngbya ohadii]
MARNSIVFFQRTRKLWHWTYPRTILSRSRGQVGWNRAGQIAPQDGTSQNGVHHKTGYITKRGI